MAEEGSSPRWRPGDNVFAQYVDEDMEEDLEEASDEEGDALIVSGHEQVKHVDNLAAEQGVDLVREPFGANKRQRIEETISPPRPDAASLFSACASSSSAAPPPSEAQLQADHARRAVLICEALGADEREKAGIMQLMVKPVRRGSPAACTGPTHHAYHPLRSTTPIGCRLKRA